MVLEYDRDESDDCGPYTPTKKKLLIDPSELPEGMYLGTKVFPLSAFFGFAQEYYALGHSTLSAKAYVIVLHIAGFAYCGLGFAALFVKKMPLKRLTAAIMNPICGCQTVFKCASFAFGIDDYIKLFSFLKKDFLSEVPANRREGVNAEIAKNVEESNMFVKYSLRYNYFTLILLSCVPIVRSQVCREFFGYGEGPVEGPNKLVENEYPFEWQEGNIYYVVYLFEQFAVMLAIFTCTAYEVILLLVVMSIVRHLRVLGYVIDNLKVTDFTGESGKVDNVAKDKAYRQLLLYVKDHQKILGAGDALADRYNFFLTFHLATAIPVVIIATFNFSIADTLEDKTKFFVMINYGILEVAVYCYCGQLLENASEDVLNLCYNCEWEEMSPQFRKTAQLMMVRSLNPLSLCAGRMYRVNLETLGKIQQMVFSSYTLLCTMEEET